jgi:predicted CoA-substrate-specific enzyme activase
MSIIDNGSQRIPTTALIWTGNGMKLSQTLQLGIDIGSTTLKVVLLDGHQIIYSTYNRHHADIRGELGRVFADLAARFPQAMVRVSVTGSGGVSVAKWLGIDFVQEVIAETETIRVFNPDTDVIIELGGEDAKITYLKPTPEQRMNGSCAGGTGAFIDQMATLLQTDATGLNQLAANYQRLYPIASRCGVFAKSDLQPLINEGASREDLAASVLQSVVNQTIAGLACGRPIRGQVVFLGGPLHFLPELRKAYERALHTEVRQFTVPEQAQLYVALGAALLARGKANSLASILDRFSTAETLEPEISRMKPLFDTPSDRVAFQTRHDRASVELQDIRLAKGDCFLGIDAGSTTTKAVLVDGEGQLIFTYYAGNKGNPLKSAVTILDKLYHQLPESARIARSCVTGYGEHLIKAGLGVDEGEIETMAHYRAAAYFQPNVDFIIDIGGQDMKCMRVRDGIIDSIMVNEACSSGCGSFIQSFAETLHMDAHTFSLEAMAATNPVDLGTRCTVFMNSRVKQAQKEGASVGDISAGLSYSVVRNALYKVIKIKDPGQLGENVVVQGGTFLNDAILRCFEQVAGREVIRPNIAGLMGAFGAALIARERFAEQATTLLSKPALAAFDVETELTHCELCTNHCQLTISRFSNGERFVSGNRCDRGAGEDIHKVALPNLFDYKYKRLFGYKPLPLDQASRGLIGIPRTLNLYENYPLWFTFLTSLGFRVVLSGRSSHKMFEKGMDSIPSESVCYPAKLAHGHVTDLIEKGLKLVFYPDVSFEQRELDGANNHFNCPIVVSYPEVIRANVEKLTEQQVTLLNPFLSLHNRKKLAERLSAAFKPYGVTRKEVAKALTKGFAEQDQFKADMQAKGQEVLQYLTDNDHKGIVLAGRPYHVDPEIHHGIPEMINSLGMAVLTEDSVFSSGLLKRPLRVVDQWAYHSRLYEAAAFVTTRPELELVQLTSFGCGLDAVTSDQVQEILEASGKTYTLLKIDEVSNLGAARIRMRSLKAAMAERAKKGPRSVLAQSHEWVRVPYTEDMKTKHTILGPQMSPIHFRMVEAVFNRSGYRTRILENATSEDIEVGLKYVNNDACYPSIIVVGQLVNAFQSGAYDPDHCSVMITQTGGGCRATNYIAFLRKALKDAGYGQVPVISLSASSLESNPGFKFTPQLLQRAVQALVLGDLLQTVLLRTRPYEIKPQSANALYQYWDQVTREWFLNDGYSPLLTRKLSFADLIEELVRQFDELPIQSERNKPRVGVVGEILVKFHPDANNNVIGVIENEGCEAVLPGLLDFFLYSFSNARWKQQNLGTSGKSANIADTVVHVLEWYRRPMVRALRRTQGKFQAPVPIKKLRRLAEPILSLGNDSGEGWFLTAEMIELIESGAPNIICAQPFACLPNHVTGKGMIKTLRSHYPESNIVAIDYDPGASEVNQLNRIKLMVSTAIRKQETQEKTVTGVLTVKQPIDLKIHFQRDVKEYVHEKN